uniref:Uncharacterized protein n=1 Tax=Haptolina ericina TaxID=156174 RepID=A0A7S3B338_9EUKA
MHALRYWWRATPLQQQLPGRCTHNRTQECADLLHEQGALWDLLLDTRRVTARDTETFVRASATLFKVRLDRGPRCLRTMGWFGTLATNTIRKANATNATAAQTASEWTPEHISHLDHHHFKTPFAKSLNMERSLAATKTASTRRQRWVSRASCRTRSLNLTTVLAVDDVLDGSQTDYKNSSQLLGGYGTAIAVALRAQLASAPCIDNQIDAVPPCLGSHPSRSGFLCSTENMGQEAVTPASMHSRTFSDRDSQRHGMQGLRGLCGATEYGGSCARADRGAWRGVRDLSACELRCKTCARCNFVSFSSRNDDCSWYRTCQMPLRSLPVHYRTIGVRVNLTLRGDVG